MAFTCVAVFIAAGFLSLTSSSRVKAGGATLFLSPTSGTFVSDSTFDISILVNTGGQAINAVSADLTFSPEQLQIIGPDSSSSFISVWIAQPTFSNTEGKIHLEGGVPTPGINSTAGNILTIKFRAKASGKAKIRFTDTSKILANDGNGTNIINSTNDGNFTITPKPPEGPKISSTTHPDQNSWYNNQSPEFAWESSGAGAISHLYDRNPSTEPDNNPEPFLSTFSSMADSDGVWFLHLKVQVSGVWGGTSHYKTQIDSTAPAKFTPVIDPSRVTMQQRPVATFQTTDATSGVDYYEIKVEGLNSNQIDTGFFTEQQSPYVLPVLEPGQYQVSVRAYDKAGNLTEGRAKIEILGTKTSDLRHNIWFLVAIIFVAILTILGIIWRRRRRQSSNIQSQNNGWDNNIHNLN